MQYVSAGLLIQNEISKFRIVFWCALYAASNSARVLYLGRIVVWYCDTANVYDGSHFKHLIDGVSHQMVVFADATFAKVDLPICVCADEANEIIGC